LFHEEAIAFFRNIGKGKVNFLFSWRTLSSALRAMLENGVSQFLRQRLRVLPGFVTEHLAKELFGDKYKSFVDCLDASPREDHLDQIVETLMPILDPISAGPIPDQALYQTIQEALDGIRRNEDGSDGGYPDYVTPTLEELGRGAREKLPGLLASTEEDGMTEMERRTWEALLFVDPEWAELTIDIANGRDLIPDFPMALCLFWTRNNRRVVVMALHFIMFAQEKSPHVWARAVMAFLHFLDILEASGNIDSAHVNWHRTSLQSFLMGVYGLGAEDNTTEQEQDEKAVRAFHDARLRCMPKGYFLGAAVGVLGTANFIGISGNSFLYIAEKLGLGNTRKLLIAHKLYAENQSNPLDPSSTCDGRPAAGGYPALQCVTPVESQEILITGALTPDHALRGTAACRGCAYNLHHRETIRLLDMSRNGTISGPQQERLNTKLRARNERRTKRLRRYHVREDKRKKEGGAPRASWMSRSATKPWHPPRFMLLLERAIGIFVFERGQKQIYWTTVVNLYKTLLVRENVPGLVVENGVVTKGGKRFALQACAEPFLQQPATRYEVFWDVKNFVDKGAAGEIGQDGPVGKRRQRKHDSVRP
jgi:hypothetical protein